MPTPSNDDQDSGLPPPGSRWGSGAQSVLPYLTKSLQARPSSAPEAREPRQRDGHPVFQQRPGTTP
ncbi:MAG TPA: hypothetical protein VHL79_23475 [Ramlibacter sp.]|jgi:hypothetical protein|nr:hypothetical protein [Ramlibacter sp.]